MQEESGPPEMAGIDGASHTGYGSAISLGPAGDLWIPTGWAEAGEEQGSTPRPALSDWASMEFADSMEDCAELDMDLEAEPPRRDQIRAADMVSEVSVPKRYCTENPQEFSLLDMEREGLAETEAEGVREGRESHPQGTLDFKGKGDREREEGTQEQEGWIQVLARRARTGGGKRRGDSNTFE